MKNKIKRKKYEKIKLKIEDLIIYLEKMIWKIFMTNFIKKIKISLKNIFKLKKYK